MMFGLLLTRTRHQVLMGLVVLLALSDNVMVFSEAAR